jgi:hypothetical protein
MDPSKVFETQVITSQGGGRIGQFCCIFYHKCPMFVSQTKEEYPQHENRMKLIIFTSLLFLGIV